MKLVQTLAVTITAVNPIASLLRQKATVLQKKLLARCYSRSEQEHLRPVLSVLEPGLSKDREANPWQNPYPYGSASPEEVVARLRRAISKVKNEKKAR